jgi:hypothetical protein
MQRCWTMLRAKMPEIEPLPPFSLPAARFFAARDDISDRVRAFALQSLKSEGSGIRQPKMSPKEKPRRWFEGSGEVL